MGTRNETKIAKNIALYGLGGVLSQAAGLITLPLMVRKLTSTEYGAIEVITATVGFFAVMVGMNTLSGLYRYYYETDGNPLERKKLVSTTFLFVLICGFVIALFSLFYSASLSMRLFQDVSYTGVIQLAFLALIPVSLYTYAMGLLRLQEKALPYIVISSIVSLFYMGSILLLVGIFRWGIKGFYFSQMIANMVGLMIAISLTRDCFLFRFSAHWMKVIAKYSFPLVPATLLAWSLSASSRLFLNAATDPVQVAYYGLANKAAIVITLATQAFCGAWDPTMYSLMKQKEKLQQKLPMIFTLYLFGSLSICILMMTIAREFFLFLAPSEYLAGIALLGMIQLRWVFTMGVYVIDPGTAKTGRTYWVTIVLMIVALVNLGANAILTPRLGLMGAVISELIGYGMAMMGRGLISNRLLPVQWNMRFVWVSLLSYGIAAWLQTQIILHPFPWLSSFAMRLGLATSMILLLWFCMGSESQQTLIQTIAPVWKKTRKWFGARRI